MWNQSIHFSNMEHISLQLNTTWENMIKKKLKVNDREEEN